MIKLHNTKTRRKEEFTPIDAENVRMYVCGPTVYDRAHLGNARPVVVFDVLYRLLKHVYDGKVTYVRNFTDVDDKINAKAAETGRDIRNITDETIDWYHEDMDALGALRPDHEPRATEYIGPMVAMIQGLIDKGHAYPKDGHVLFDVTSYDAYGALSGRKLEDMRAGERVEIGSYKDDPMDFVLWKPSTDDQPSWNPEETNPDLNVEFGPGRPGWHIECSAMAEDLLWEKPKREGKLSSAALLNPHVIDIHAGGLDLQFPHHENEIAQSCCANKTDNFANYWLHNEMLQVEGKKMSKSLGNFFTVKDLLDKGVPGEVIRFVLLSTHYRSPMDWTEKKVKEAEKKLSKWFRKTDGIDEPWPVPSRVLAALEDDLNTHLAMSEMDQMSGPALKASMRLMGFPDAEDVNWFRASPDMIVGVGLIGGGNLAQIQTQLHDILVRWQNLRDEKKYSEADHIKDILSEIGVSVQATGDGPQAHINDASKFDPAKLEALK